MGRTAKKISKDIVLKEFWRSNDRFADLFNAVIFEGQEILRAEDMQEMDTDVSGVIRFSGYEESLMRIRDVVKKYAFGIEFAILGIENQQKIHYAMPLRTMVYDACGYLKEYKAIARTIKSGRKSESDEFLSGMNRMDRLHPQITLVIYYGEKEWDGPYCLHDMLVPLPKQFLKVCPNYRMNLVQIRESDAYIFHNEDVRTVFDISREIYNENFDRIFKEYNYGIKPELATVIGRITNAEGLAAVKNEEGTINVCEALKKLERECEARGMQKGEAHGKVLGLEAGLRKSIIQLLKNGFSIEQISAILEMPEEEVKQIRG